MSNELIEVLDRVIASVAQEFHKEASVLVQFAAGDWHALKEALSKAKGDVPAPLVGFDIPAEEVSPPADASSAQESEPASSPAPESFLPPGYES